MNTTRRSFLRSAGATAMLPLLGSAHAKAAASASPKRLIFLNYGFGPSEAWYPTGEGVNYTMSKAMNSLGDLRDSFSVLTNLTNVQASGTGAHWGATTWLTGADVRRTPGREFHNAISCDQVAAAHLGQDVRFASLSLSAPDGDVVGMGPGTSLSWDPAGNPILAMTSQTQLFSQLYGDGGMSLEDRYRGLERQRSVLDAIGTDANAVTGLVNSRDREKVGEYFQLIDNIETRLDREEDWLDRPKPEAPIPAPTEDLVGTPGVEQMFDLMVSAFQTDSTRVITYRLPGTSLFNEFELETGNKKIGAHPMTHYGPKTSVAYQQLTWRDEKVCSLYATLIEKLMAAKDANGTPLLDNTMVVMGSGLRTGHKRRNLPILVGGGGDAVQHGHNYVYEADKTPLGNLWLSMLNWAGCPETSFADSDGRLTEMFS